MFQIIKDVLFAYVISFPIAITLLISQMVFLSSGKFSIDMTKYGEFYFEAVLFAVWILLLLFFGGKFLKGTLVEYCFRRT